VVVGGGESRRLIGGLVRDLTLDLVVVDGPADEEGASSSSNKEDMGALGFDLALELATGFAFAISSSRLVGFEGPAPPILMDSFIPSEVILLKPFVAVVD
jgi:hypothetical protein